MDDIWRPGILYDLVGSGLGASTGSGRVPTVGSGEGDREEQVDTFEAGGLFKMLCGRAHFPRLDFPRLVHSAYHICARCGTVYATLRDGIGGVCPRWYIYHKKWYIYHFEVIWLRVGILLKSQIPVNQKHWYCRNLHVIVVA
jgi:hypothetical protein